MSNWRGNTDKTVQTRTRRFTLEKLKNMKKEIDFSFFRLIGVDNATAKAAKHAAFTGKLKKGVD